MQASSRPRQRLPVVPPGQSRRGRLARALAWAGTGLLVLTLTAASASAQGLYIIHDAEIEALLSDYARPLFEAAGLGRQRVRVRIVRNTDFNAFVLDGRNVFINTGALLQAETPNEVIGVIAHETGHIRGGHIASLQAKIAHDSNSNLLLKLIGIGAIMAGSIAGKDNGGEIGTGAGQSILSGADMVTIRSILSLRRAQEGAADQAGVSYLNATRQSANGMLRTFQRFAEDELYSDRPKNPYVVSHPMAQNRISQLAELSQRSPYFDTKDPPELQLRHDLMRAKLSGYLEPSKVLNSYPPGDTSLPARYARAYAAVYSSGIGEAMPKVDALIEADRSYAYFWELKGDLLMRKGDAEAAIAPLKKALQLAKNDPQLHVKLGQAMTASQNKAYLKEAIAHLRKGLVDGDNPMGLRQLATAYSQAGEEGLAYLNFAKAAGLEGKLDEAKNFATRAQAFFPADSAIWLQADDIISIKP